MTRALTKVAQTRVAKVARAARIATLARVSQAITHQATAQAQTPVLVILVVFGSQ